MGLDMIPKNSSMSGALYVFDASKTPPKAYVCDDDTWKDENTRVACRQLGFKDGVTGRYRPEYVNDSSSAASSHTTMHHIVCTGNETSLFECQYPIGTFVNCRRPVYIRCLCSACEQFLLSVPGGRQAAMGSIVSFRWNFSRDVGAEDLEIWFQSRKNPQLLLSRTDGRVKIHYTGFAGRIRLTTAGSNESNWASPFPSSSVEFNITSVRREDIGIYALHLPRLRFYNSLAILYVTDFAVTPDPTVSRRPNETLTLTWDFTVLRQVADIQHGIILSTPRSGRVPFDQFYRRWIPDNGGGDGGGWRSVRLTFPLSPTPDQPQQPLSLSFTVDGLEVLDAGEYTVELWLSSRTHSWLNSTRQFTTTLVILQDDANDKANCVIATVVLSVVVVLLVIAVLAISIVRRQNPVHQQKALEMSFAPTREERHSRPTGNQEVVVESGAADVNANGNHLSLIADSHSDSDHQRQQQPEGGSSAEAHQRPRLQRDKAVTGSTISTNDSTPLDASSYMNSDMAQQHMVNAA
jgi:hypothetical protein